MEFLIKYQDIILLLLKIVTGVGLLAGAIYALQKYRTSLIEFGKGQFKEQLDQNTLTSIKTTSDKIEEFRKMSVDDRNKQFVDRLHRKE